jgi:peptide/nickel transport system permease protein
LFFAAIPTFWLGMMLMLILSLKFPIFPATGVTTWKGYILPSLSLGLPFAAQQLRFARSSMLETIRQDYIRTARAKGAPENVVIWKHALKNALMPIITIIGINFGLILGGAVATETLFSIPGLGSMVVTGIKMKDIPMVMGGIIVLSIFCSLIMLIVDLLYALIDPRIKAKYSKGKRATI